MGERVERLETVYVATQEMFAEIRDHLAKQNGDIARLQEFRIAHDATRKAEGLNAANMRWWLMTAIAANGAVVAILQVVLK